MRRRAPTARTSPLPVRRVSIRRPLAGSRLFRGAPIRGATAGTAEARSGKPLAAAGGGRAVVRKEVGEVMEGGFGWIPRAGDCARPQGPGRRGVSHLRVVHVPWEWMDGMACSAERETTTTSRRGDCSMPCVRREGDQSPVLHPPRTSRSFLVPPHLTRRCCRTGTSPGLARHPARLSLQRPTNLPCPGGLGCLGARGPHHAGGFPGTQRRCRRAVPPVSGTRVVAGPEAAFLTRRSRAWVPWVIRDGIPRRKEERKGRGW